MGTNSSDLALAFDIGTTTIAASLLERRSGVRLAVAGSMNPQREFGADVIARLQAACSSPASRMRLRDLINGELERLGRELLERAEVAGDKISAVAFAGNPAMEHFLLGLPVEALAFPPYRPLFSKGRTMTTTELGWNLAAEAFIFPLPGGYVGGDLVAFLYGAGIVPDPRSPIPDPGVSDPRAPIPDPGSPRLFIDMGTNGEIALVGGGRIYATSAAAGPALEGGNLSCGMVALPGAINRVRFVGERVELDTIGGGAPIGLCGSAVIDAVAELVRVGVVDPTGRLLPPAEISSNLANRIVELEGESAFILHRDATRLVYLSQGDIRQVQLAKAAIRAGMEVLFRKSGIARDSLQELILTGSFGAELLPASLKNIGVFTENMVKVASFVREGALRGVERSLSARYGFAAVTELSRTVRVIPLSGTPAFEKTFVEQMNFPIPEA